MRRPAADDFAGGAPPRVWPTTLARASRLAVLFGALVALVGGCRGSSRPAVPPPPALAETTGLLIADGALFDGPAPGAARVGTVARSTPVRLAARGLACPTVAADRCSERWLLAGTATWVSGDALAVTQATPSLETDLGGHLLHERPQPSDASRAPAFAWFGVQTSWEWSEELGRERVAAQGWLAIDAPGGVRAVALGESSGWGSADVIVDRRWLDLDGDGAAEAVVVSSTTLTEVGYGGLLLRVLGGDLVTRLELEVGDARVNGLGQTSWGAVRLEGTELVHDALEAAPCSQALPPPKAPDPDQTGAMFCFVATRTRYAGLRPRTEPLAILADGASVQAWYHPQGPAPSDPAPVRVLVTRGDRAQWVESPGLTPLWVQGVFSADRERTNWVTLW